VPKPRLKSVGDGKQVNIPAPAWMVSTGGTEKDSRAGRWFAWFKPVGRRVRRPCATNGASIPRGEEESACAHKLGDSQLPRKAPVECTARPTVPQTDTGGRGEYPKALEKTLLKELGKMTP
jgi:hypothetical protein